MLKLQKRLFDKTVVQFKKRILDLEQIVAQQSREIKIQALKLKELITADMIKRNSIVNRDFQLLQQLSNPRSPPPLSTIDVDPKRKEGLMRNEFKKDLHQKYGRVNSLTAKKSVNTSQTDRLLSDPYSNIDQSQNSSRAAHNSSSISALP